MASSAPLFYLLEGRHLDCRGGEAGRTLHAAKERLYTMLKLQSLPGPAMESALASAEVNLDLRGSASADAAETASNRAALGDASAHGDATPRGVRGWHERVQREQAVGGTPSPVPNAADSEHGNSTQAVLGEMLLTETIGIAGLFARHAEDEFGRQPDQGEHEGSAGGMSLKAQLGTIARNRLFLALTLSLSGLYFVVTGIQFWVTDYMVRTAP